VKHYHPNFNKRSRLGRTPELDPDGVHATLPPLDPASLPRRLAESLRINNDFFPCFDWVFPPPVVTKSQPPDTTAELFSRSSPMRDRFSLYLHTPFCRTLCRFCYYAVLPGRGIEQAATYVDYLIREMALYREAVSDRVCESVYLGGGTPTFLDDALLERLFAALRRNFRLEPDAEITVESAPGTLPRTKVRLLRDLGVTRLSYGIQTLDERLLAALNRDYSVREAIGELDDAVTQIGNVNVDTMYGFEGEAADTLMRTLLRFHQVGVPGFSIYALDSQRNRPKDELLPPKDPDYAGKIRRFSEAEALLADLGYRRVLQNVFVDPARGSYRHQLRRWDNLPLVALGINAQGYAPRRPYQNIAALKGYYAAIDAGRAPIATVDDLTPEMDACRELTSKLRFTFAGTRELEYKYGVDFARTFHDLTAALADLGYLAVDGDAMRMTAKAAYYNNLIPMLYAPDAFKEQLLGLPEEYLEAFPVPAVLTRLGRTESVPLHLPETGARIERRARFDRRKDTSRRPGSSRRGADRYRAWLPVHGTAAGTQRGRPPV